MAIICSVPGKMDPTPFSVLRLEVRNSATLTARSVNDDVERNTAQARETHHKPFASLRYALLSTYRRLFSLVFIGNAAAFIFITVRKRFLLDFINASAINLLACGLSRQPLVVNALFRLFCAVPRSAPLRLRHLACKVYHLGGVHSGCGVAACIWYLGFFTLFCVQFSTSASSTTLLVLASLVTGVFVSIVSAAYPAVRRRSHDLFELLHRFGSWTVLALFWALLLVFAFAQTSVANTPGQFLVVMPAFWCLLLSTVATIHPWAMLRHVDVMPEDLSTHAIRLHFKHTSIVCGQGVSLSRHPLRDWHSFATITDRFDNTSGTHFSCLVSKAGDWTAAAIANKPTKLWVRSVPVYGFGYAMRVFTRIIVVTTGSGIGPCLSFVDDDSRPKMRVVWQTRTPLKTYGQRTVDLVHKLDAEPIIFDTASRGRVDMLPIVIALWRDFMAEAVCVISNPAVTKHLVFELESRGIRAYGPIFDS